MLSSTPDWSCAPDRLPPSEGSSLPRVRWLSPGLTRSALGVVTAVVAVSVLCALPSTAAAPPDAPTTTSSGSASTVTAAAAPSVRVSSSGTVQPGTAIQVTATDLVKGAAVVVRLDGALLTRVPASTRTWFSVRVSVPATTVTGVHRVSVTQPGTTGAGGSPVAASTTVAVHTDWPQNRGGPRGNGFARLENGITTTNAATLKTAWATPNRTARAVSVADGVLYVSEDVDRTSLIGGVGAYDAATGTKLWETQRVGTELSTPLILNGKVWVVDGGGQVAIIDAKTGTILKYLNTKGDTGGVGPIFTAGLVVLATGIAIDPTTYQTVWDAKVSVLVGAGGLLFGNSPSGILLAVDAATGRVVWVADPPYSDDAYTTNGIAVGGDTVLVSWDHGEVAAYDQATGALRWITSADAHYGGGSLSSDGTRVYVQPNGGVDGTDHRFRALDLATGDLVWVGPTGTYPQAGPAIAGGVLFATTLTPDLSTGGFSSLDAATGKILATTPPGAGAQSAIAIADGRLYYTDYDHDLIAISPAS